MDAVTAKGQTPASNSPTDIALAIENISSEMNIDNMNLVTANWSGSGPWALDTGQTATMYYRYTSTFKGSIIWDHRFNGGTNSGGAGYYTQRHYIQRTIDGVTSTEEIIMKGSITVEVGDILYWSYVAHVTTPMWTQLSVSGSATIIEFPE